MYVCRIKACGLIARPTLKLHQGCVQPEPLTAGTAPTTEIQICAVQICLWLLPLLHFSQPTTFRKKIPENVRGLV